MMDASQFIPRGLYSYLNEETPCVLHEAGYFRVVKFDQPLLSDQAVEIVCRMCPFSPKLALEALRWWSGGSLDEVLRVCVNAANAPAFRLFAGNEREEKVYKLRQEIGELPGFIEAVGGGQIGRMVHRMLGYFTPETYEKYMAGWKIKVSPFAAMMAGNLPLIRHLVRKGELFIHLDCGSVIYAPARAWHEVVKLGFSKARVEEIFREHGYLESYRQIEDEI